MLGDLYREVIMDHHQNPRGASVTLRSNAHAQGKNPLCGDVVDVDLEIHNNHISKAKAQCDGCAICVASGSMLTELVQHHDIEEVQTLIQKVKTMITQGEELEDLDEEINALAGVSKFPMRIKCALLPWVTLSQAMEERTFDK